MSSQLSLAGALTLPFEQFQGGTSLALSRLALTLAYLVLTGGFGALIGLLLLQEDLRSRERREAENHGMRIPTDIGRCNRRARLRCELGRRPGTSVSS